MNILVTGSAVMIGEYVVKGLVENGHMVIGVDRRKNENANKFSQVVLDFGLKEDAVRSFDQNK